MRYAVVGLVFLVVGCYDPPVAPEVAEDEPCTVYIVNAITGDTTVVSPWTGPPLGEIELFDVADAWYEGDCDW